MGLAIFAKYAGMSEISLKEAVEEEICQRLCLEAVCFMSDIDMESLDWMIQHWYSKVSNPKPGIDIDVQVTLTGPVICAGAPAAAYLPAAFQRLNTECILPEPYAVTCAVGAVVGTVNTKLTGEIRPTATGKYSLHTPHGKEVFDHLIEAILRGRMILETLVRDQMLRNYVTDPLLEFSTEEKRAKTNSGQEIYLATILYVQAAGRPNVWRQDSKLD